MINLQNAVVTCGHLIHNWFTLADLPLVHKCIHNFVSTLHPLTLCYLLLAWMLPNTGSSSRHVSCITSSTGMGASSTMQDFYTECSKRESSIQQASWSITKTCFWWWIIYLSWSSWCFLLFVDFIVDNTRFAGAPGTSKGKYWHGNKLQGLNRKL